jgi:hypothetical protein
MWRGTARAAGDQQPGEPGRQSDRGAAGKAEAEAAG